MNTKCRWTKKELSKDLDIPTKRLTIVLKVLEPELLKMFPGYSRNCQTVGRLAYKYIIEQLHTDEPDEVKEIMHRPRTSWGDNTPFKA